MWVDIDDKETTKAIRAACDVGITTFDTAEAYGKGHIDLYQIHWPSDSFGFNEELSEIDEIGRGVTDYLDEDPVMWNL
jgi:aryl-alcohol dehydrogenase-like predicted oxidoreductase